MDNQTPDQILKSILQVVDTKKTITNFVESFKLAVEALVKMRDATQEELVHLRAAFDQAIKDLRRDSEDSNTREIGNIKADLITQVGKALREQESGMNYLRDWARNLPPAKDGITPVKGVDYFDGSPGKDATNPTPDTAAQVRDKLETLDNDERLDATAIKGLEAAIKRYTPKAINQPSIVISRGQVKIYDLSDLLDGVTKTFSLPTFWRVLTVDLSSFPNALRPIVDYTTDGSLMKITFTSAIDAASSLSNGQTCIVTYAEP